MNTKKRRARSAPRAALARRLDSRLAELRRQFARLVRAGDTQRRGREGAARIVLVGYTNAGKTSLMNALAATELSARDLPFETLDTTSRCLKTWLGSSRDRVEIFGRVDQRRRRARRCRSSRRCFIDWPRGCA